MDSANLTNFYLSVDSESTLKSFVQNKTKEDLHLEFKQKQDSRNGDLGDRDKFNFSKALSGFANSDGGVLFWGIETSKKDESAKKLKPIHHVDDFIRGLKSSLLTTVQPFVDNVLIKKINKENSSSIGYVKCLIPQSDKTPHRAMNTREYYKRSVEGFYRLEHFDLEDMFGRRQKPLLVAQVTDRQYPGDDPEMREVCFAFRNEGRAIARYYGFLCKFDDNIELIGSPDLSIEDVTKLNNGKPTINYSNNIGVIHPNNITYNVGSMRYKVKDKTKKIQGGLNFYCDGMFAKSSNLQIGQ